MKRMAPVVAVMAVFTLAVCFIIFGSVSEEMKKELSIDNDQYGQLILVFSITCMIVQLLVGPLVDRFGHKPLALFGFLFTGASIFVLAFAATFVWAIAAAVLLGIGAIFCNTVGNTLLPVVLFGGKEPARASNLGNGFVGLGFVLTPLVIGTLIHDLGLSYSTAVSVIGVMVLAFAICALAAEYPHVPTGFEVAKVVRLLREPLVLLAALALVCYIGLEWSMNTWLKPLMTELFGGDANPQATRNAGWVLSLFGLGMAVGRFATSAVKDLSRVGTWIIAGGSLISIVALLALGAAQSPAVAVAAVLTIGLVFAPMFPTIVGYTFARFDSSLYGSIFGIIFSIGLLGSFLPRIIGARSVESPVRDSLPIAAAVAGVLLVLAVIMGLAGKGKAS